MQQRHTTYLDANASEPLRPQAREAVLAALALDGNPASVHAAGRAARRALEDARQIVAARFGAAPADVVFTSGGTEANALAIAGLGAACPATGQGERRRVMVGATEHDAVRAAAPGALVLPVGADGQLDLDALAAALAHGPPALVCLMLANNETGVLHPVAEAAALCRANGARLHVDAVQAAGRMACTLAGLGADSLAISGHKLGGPKGAGALVLAPGTMLAAQIAGGGQERGRRGGTPALPAIAGLAAALLACGESFDGPGSETASSRAASALSPGAGSEPGWRAAGQTRLARLRDRLEAACVAQGAIVCGGGLRLANTSCLARPGVRADMQVIALDLAGIAVSAGAACSSGKVARSHVLDAMGLGALAGCAIRVSLPWHADDEDVDRFLAAYATLGRAAPAPLTAPTPLTARVPVGAA